MTRQSVAKCVLAAGSVFGTFASAASASSWTYAGDGIWQTPTNWLGGTPTAADPASFGRNASYTVTAANDAAAASLAINAGTVGFDFTGRTLGISGATILAAGAVAAWQGGTLSTTSLDSTAGQRFDLMDGTLVINGGVYRPKETEVTGFDHQIAFSYLPVSGATGSVARPVVAILAGGTSSLDRSSAGSPGSIYIGNDGGKGGAIVDGPGSILRSGETGGNFIVGNGTGYSEDVAYASDGSISVSRGAQLTTRAYFAIGSNGGTGNVMVDGEGSKLTSRIGSLLVATAFGETASYGTLTLTHGGQAEANVYVVIGDESGVGRVDVDGVGSKLTSGDLTYIGFNSSVAAVRGVSMLNVLNGGEVVSHSEIIVGGFGGAGSVVIDGAGSKMSNLLGSLYIGYAEDYSNILSEGTLIVTNGGQATSAVDVVIGSGGRGFVSVGKSDGSDTGQTQLNAINLSIGAADFYSGYVGSVLNLYAGGKVDIARKVSVDAEAGQVNQSQINLLGGRLSCGSLVNAAFVNVSSGTLVTGLIDGTGTMNLSGGATKTASIRQGNLSISGTASIDLSNASATSTSSVVGTIQFAGSGKFDLSDNALVVTYSGDTPYPNVRAAAASGYNGGTRDGTGLTSQSATRNNAVAVVEATELFSTFPQTFAGVSIDDTTLIAYATTAGDANLDRAVNSIDFNALVAHFGTASTKWTSGDFDYNGSIDTADFATLIAGFGRTFSYSAELPGAPVPEPACLATGITLLLAARRRRVSKKAHADAMA